MLLIIHWLLYNNYLYTYLHLQFWHSRRSRIHKQPPEVFLKFFANFTGKHLCWSLFFTKLQAFRPATLLKIDSYTGVFLWNLRNSEEHLFWRTSERLLLCIDDFIIYWFVLYQSQAFWPYYTWDHLDFCQKPLKQQLLLLCPDASKNGQATCHLADRWDKSM